VPFTFGNADTAEIEFVVPITGWASTVVMSNDTDTRVVAAMYTTATGTPSGSASVTKYSTKVFDTHNAYSTSTGLYTAPVSGYYDISAQFRINGTFSANQYIEAAVYVNGVQKNTGRSENWHIYYNCDSSCFAKGVPAQCRRYDWNIRNLQWLVSFI
jgi:hypothetical protein